MLDKAFKFTLIDRLFVGILLVVFTGIVVHAPFSVAFSSLFPQYQLLFKSWKEILMLVAGLLMIIILYTRKKFEILKSPLILLIAAYAGLHLLLVFLFSTGITALIAGLFIDLRYLLFFGLAYVAMCLYPSLRRPFVLLFFVGAFIVAAFALLQVFVLPHDILKYIGYNESTIAAYLTVDQNPQFIRINSTLRGPNPLGAYAVIVLALVFAYWLKVKPSKERRPLLVISVIIIGSVVALWVSYSRSALIAAFAATGVIITTVIGRRISRKAWIAILIGVVVVAGGLFAARNSNFVSNVVLHDNGATGASVNSNQGHVTSLEDGVGRMIHQPLGGGIGSTGSASLYGNSPLIVENQYLFIAHEAGWLGLGLFLVILFLVLRGLWRARADWLALGVFASGIGLALIGLLLPVWVDDAVGIIWWGLAAVVLGDNKVRGDSDGRKINKKTKRAA